MNKDNLTSVEKIEYCLGKDRFPNLHWQSTIPPAWQIPPRPDMLLCNHTAYNKVVVLENISYALNNLGYRSNFDYHLEELKNKQLVLILGDSDTFSRGISFDHMYSTKIQQQTDLCVVNLGIPGISPDGMTRVGVQTILALGSAIKHVCVLWPVSSLREFVSKKFNSGVHTHSSLVPYTDWWNHIDWVNNNYNHQKNKILIEQTTLSIGAKYHELIVNRYDKTSPITYTKLENNTWTEFDQDSHIAIANYYLRKIQGRPSLYEQLNTQS